MRATVHSSGSRKRIGCSVEVGCRARQGLSNTRNHRSAQSAANANRFSRLGFWHRLLTHPGLKVATSKTPRGSAGSRFLGLILPVAQTAPKSGSGRCGTVPRALSFMGAETAGGTRCENHRKTFGETLRIVVSSPKLRLPSRRRLDSDAWKRPGITWQTAKRGWTATRKARPHNGVTEVAGDRRQSSRMRDCWVNPLGMG